MCPLAWWCINYLVEMLGCCTQTRTHNSACMKSLKGVSANADIINDWKELQQRQDG